MAGKTFGDWNKAGQLFYLAKTRIRKDAQRALRECAEIYYNEVIRLINEGLGTWPPLSDEWVAQKGHSNFYQYKMDFISNITIRGVKGSYTGQKLFVGASPYKTHSSGIRMDKFSEILQFEYDRPLFGPAYDNVKFEMEEKLRNVGAEIFKR